MLSILNPYVILAAIVAGAGLFSAGYVSNDQDEKVLAAWQKAEKEATQARAVRIARARDEERQEREDHEKRRRELDEKASRTAAAYERTIAGLRDRARRPAPGQPDVHPGTPGPAAQGPGRCTGADLYRDDGEVLARFARTASDIRDQRDYCYSQYEAAQRRLRAQGLTP